MNDFYTFIILSTLNTSLTKFSNLDRYYQTLETIISIRKKVKNCKIIFIDNSILPVEEDKKTIIRNLVDIYEDYEQNLFSTYVNQNVCQVNKGLNELLMLEFAFKIIRKNNLIGKRIFKISGRYKLSDSFDISMYDNQHLGKYVIKYTPWIFSDGVNTTNLVFFETTLWSLCETLFEETHLYIQQSFDLMIKNFGKNLETSFFEIFPKEKCVVVDTIHVNGFMTKGDYISY